MTTSLGYSLFRILWAPIHLAFAGALLQQAALERFLPTLPYPGPFALFAALPFEGLVIMGTAHIIVALLLLTGWRTRIMQDLLAVTTPLLFFRSVSTYQNHNAFLLLVTLWCTAMPSERFFSLDARRKRRKLSPTAFHAWQREPVSLFAQRMILLEASFLYLFAGLNKLDPDWFLRWSTTPEILALTENEVLASLWSFLLTHNLAWMPIGALASFMLFLSVGIFLGNRFPAILLLAATMHLLLDLHLHIMLFTHMMLAVLLLALFPLKPGWLRTIAGDQ